MTHAEKEMRNQKIIELRKQGYSMNQLAEMYGLTLSGIHTICKRYGVAGVMSDRKPLVYKGGTKNQFKKETEEERRAYVESLLPMGFSYVGGYIDCEHKVTIQCKVCGLEFERSMVSIRHGNNTICPYCFKADIAEKKQREQKQKAKQKSELEQQRAEARERKAEARTKWVAERIHACPVCGTMTTNRKYCSTACSTKANNHRKELKRRAKLANALVDSDIEIHELFIRDNGVCHICGGQCDWNDKEIRPTGIVCGDLYPSVDHVVPLAKGGLHKWNNVRLAHRICNSLKGDYIPLGA